MEYYAANLLRLVDHPLYNLLFVMVVLWSVGILFERLNFPLIIGELAAGVVIGPAVLNLIAPNPIFDNLAQLGMFFLMFYAGMESDPRNLKQSLKPALYIGLWGTAFPFALGFAASLFFGLTVPQALLIGAAISGTSLVTKTRILTDLNILKSRFGQSMIGAAIMDNTFSFLVLSLIVKSIKNGGGLHVISAAFTAGEVILFFGLTLFIGALIMPKLGPLFSQRRGKGFTFALIMGLLFAVLAEALGLPYILGAYLAGLFVREEIMSRELYQKMDDRFLAIAHGFLGPIFIMSVSLKVTFDIISIWGWFILAILASAFFGKMLGVYLGGRLSGVPKDEAVAMGFGMNGRGAVELVLAVVGVELGILTNQHLSVLVLVAFTTTFLVPILLRWYIKRTGLIIQ